MQMFQQIENERLKKKPNPNRMEVDWVGMWGFYEKNICYFYSNINKVSGIGVLGDSIRQWFPPEAAGCKCCEGGYYNSLKTQILHKNQ